MGDTGPRIPDFLMGLAPATASDCPRCGSRTAALSNGRGRIDFCAACGTLELASAEGLPVLKMRDLSLPNPPRTAHAKPGLHDLSTRKP